MTLFTQTLLLLKRLSIPFLFLSLTRALFYFYNLDHFTNAGILDFIYGCWFDAITIALFFSPFIVLHILPINGSKGHKIQELVLKIVFHITNTLLVALNLMDFEYFKYTSKRSTADLFAILGAGDDFAQLATTFIANFWILIILLIAFVFAGEWIYKRVSKNSFTPHKWQNISFNFLIILPLFVIIARGGLQLKPIGIIEAAQFSAPENTALVLNTPFTMIKSYGHETLEEKHFFSEERAKKLFNPEQISQPQHILPDKTNLVIIILESFGNEWVGAFNHSTTYTPFFDSLIAESWTFEYGIANGKKSIEAVPSIIASIPSLMDNPYISSPYGNNKIRSLADILRENGYSTAFYHGATNGSMRFNGFAAQAGFEKYFGRYEYNNDKHFDKTWGILDEYFNPWTARQLSKLKTPFFGTLFTLSSHHPYYIPPHYIKKAKKGPHPICASINYGDYALKKFFEEAKKQKWYKNTLFVLVADHTPATNDPFYSDRSMMYRIPIVFYHPNGKLGKKREKKIFQQLDILPTALDLLNIKTNFYSYGFSAFTKQKRQAITYLEGTYYHFFEHYISSISNEKARNLYVIPVRKESATDSLGLLPKLGRYSERIVKAIIQRYNRDLIRNKTAVE